MVARFGGDEFVIVQTGVLDESEAEAFARRIMSISSGPLYFKEVEICSTSTIGVAMAPRGGAAADRLLTSADLALYAGKTAGRNCVRCFMSEMDESMRKRVKNQMAAWKPCSRGIIDLGRGMKMRVTVEGVETERQVDFLYNAHADQVQGFYFGEPLAASELGADVLRDLRTHSVSTTDQKLKQGAQVGKTQSALAAKLHDRAI